MLAGARGVRGAGGNITTRGSRRVGGQRGE